MPNYELIIEPGAVEQVEKLRIYHESKRAGKGGDFLEVLLDCLESLQTRPQKWQFLKTKELGTRRAITKPPQTIIIYEIENKVVYITDIYDSRSNWK